MNSGHKKPKMQGKKPSHRSAIIRSQVLELIRSERIKTTRSKAKILKQRFDILVNEAKKQTPSSKRRVGSFLRNNKAEVKLFNVLLPRLEGSKSGYTLSAHTLPRKGDNASQTIVAIKGYKPPEKKSRLAAALQRQEKDKKETERRGIRQAVSRAIKSDAGKKHESAADTRRVST